MTKKISNFVKYIRSSTYILLPESINIPIFYSCFYFLVILKTFFYYFKSLPSLPLTLFTHVYMIKYSINNMSLNTYGVRFINKESIITKITYYKKSDCRFLLCESCYWCTTILKNEYNIDTKICPICNKKRMYIKNIF